MPRKHRRRSWGSITESVKGKKYVLRWVENTDEGRKRMCRTFEGTYREASLWLDRKHAEMGDSKVVPTVSQCAEMWYVPYLERHVESGKIRRSTADSKIRLLNDAVYPFLGKACIDSVDVASTQRWLLGMPRSRAENVLSILRGIDRQAYKFIRHDNRPIGPDMEYEVPPRYRKVKSDRVYPIEEAEKIMGMLRGNDMLEAPFIIAAFGGARVTESAAVKACEVEQDEAHGVRCAVVPILRHTLASGYETTDDGVLKNAQSERETVIPAPFGDRLVQIAEERREAGVEWLCDRGDGLPLNGQMLKYFWNEFLKGNGLDPMPFSNLRKSWRTYMQTDYHVPWETLEVLMGHKIKGVTGAQYFKPTRSQLVSEVCRCAALR